MQDLITSYLIQSKECSLPGIGTFQIVVSPAETNIADKVIFPPKEEILFNARSNKLSEDLVKYIASKENISQADALEKIKSWCREEKNKLNDGGKIIFKTIGSLQKNNVESIFLATEDQFDFLKPVAAERVIHKNAEHSVLVGDRETTSSAMNQFFQEEAATKNYPWKIVAIILFVIAIALLFIHFYSHTFSFSTTGNQNHHSPETPAATYTTQ